MSADPGKDGVKAPIRSLGKPTWFKNAGATNSLGRRAHYAQMPHQCVFLWLPGVENEAVGLMWWVKHPESKGGTRDIN